MIGRTTASEPRAPLKHAGRKLYHLLGGAMLILLNYILGRERALLSYAALFLLVVVFEVLRFTNSSFNQFLFARFSSFLRTNEERRITGTGPYVLGVGASFLLYGSGIATAAVSFLAVGDVAATLVGERWGKTKISGPKSLEGTLAFAAASLFAGSMLLVAGLPLTFGAVLAGALIGTAVELLPLPVNDNLLIPLVSGGVMEMILRMQG
jgi:glycerol-3-phosphate acyltransferase PlsY